MNRISSFFAAGLMLCQLNSCTKDEEPDSKCGNEEVFEMDYNFITNPGDTALLHMYYYQPDQNHVKLQFWKLYTNICTFEHIRVGETIEVSAKYPCIVTANLGLCPGIPNVEIQLTAVPVGDRIQYKSLLLNEGLQQCYDEGPGQFWLKTDFMFTKQATRQLDIEYFLDSLAPVILHRYDFHWYKPPA
jgi:hypothetical protein